jgi:hypothetical protein
MDEENQAEARARSTTTSGAGAPETVRISSARAEPAVPTEA